MSRRWLAVVLLLGVSLSPNVRAQTNATSPEEQTRLVLHLSSVPAHDTANILRQVFQGEGQAAPPAASQLTIVADPVSNSLILGGPASAVEEARRLADELDRPAAAVESPQTNLERLVLLIARVERIGEVAPTVNNH